MNHRPPPPFPRRVSLALALAVTFAVGWSQPASAETRPLAVGAGLPDSPRLQPVRSELERIVRQAARDGLPADVLVVKVREGLAKGASPELIRAAVEKMALVLGEARGFLRARGQAAPAPALVRAVADAKASGLVLESSAPLLPVGAGAGGEARLIRAYEVLAELGSRGYPGTPAALVVRDVATRDPGSLGHVVPGLESIRRGQTVSRAEALETLGRNLAGSGSLDAAVNRSLEGREHGAASAATKNGQGNDHAAAASKKGMGQGMGPNK